MLVMDQRLGVIFRYRKAYFPTLQQARELSGSLAVNDIVRFEHPACDSLDASRSLVERFPVSTVCVDLDQEPESLLKGMDRNCRKGLRIAEELASQISIIQNEPMSVEHCLSLYNSFALAKGRVPVLSRDRLLAYAQVCDVFVLYLDGREMCAHVTLYDSTVERAIVLISASRRFEGKEEGDLCGALNRYLHWHEFSVYKQRGAKVYDFGGIGHENPRSAPFNRFKMSFGGHIVSEYSYTFAGARFLGRLGAASYNKLRKSRAAWLVPHL
jgi:hypothetical protein